MLKGTKPTTTEKRLKALFYGEAGAGKTTAAISFPSVYLIDTEKGSVNDQYVKLINDNNGAVFHTTDFDDLVCEVKSLLTERHHYKTLVIDPLTIVYNNLLDKCESQVGSEFGRHYGAANKEMKRLLNLLIRLPMNVIVICHAKKEYGTNLSVLGETFDGYKKLDYLFDLVFFLQKRGKQRVAIVRKTRIEAFEDGEAIPFSYDEIANRYGRQILEKNAEPQELVTQSMVMEIQRLIDLFKVPPDTVQKWLDKSSAIDLNELPKDAGQKIIDHLTKQVKG